MCRIVGAAGSEEDGQEGEKGKLVHKCYGLFKLKVFYEALRVCARVGRRHFQPGGNPPIKPSTKQVIKPARKTAKSKLRTKTPMEKGKEIPCSQKAAMKKARVKPSKQYAVDS